MPYKVKKLTPIDASSLDSLGKSVTDLSKYTEDEFAQVARSFQSIEPETVLHKAPPKPRPGTIIYADGSDWNPGSGEGPYYYNSAGAWVPMFGGGTGGGGGGATVYVQATAPTGASPGSLWWRTTDGQLFILYNDGNSTQWVAATSVFGAALNQVYIGPSPPTGSSSGVLWWNSTVGLLYISYYDGTSTQWVQI